MYDKKYRPDTFNKVIGNKSQVLSLETNVAAKSPRHAYLIEGPFGVGKTTLARIACSSLGINKFNITEMNLAKDGLKEDSNAINEA